MPAREKASDSESRTTTTMDVVMSGSASTVCTSERSYVSLVRVRT
jgi:hypothetical protein